MKLQALYGFDSLSFKDDGHKWNEYCGIELEIENPSRQPDGLYWSRHADGSLRDGVEYVMTRPEGGKQLEAAIEEFYNFGIEFTNGPRTSTHIHVNVSNCTADELRAMVVAMYTIEDGLFTVIGERRKWAGYAMPLSEMDNKRLRSLMAATDFDELFHAISPARNQERYYGFNTCVRKHGTVEFRYFPGGPTKTELCDWVDLVIGVRKATGTSIETLMNIGNNEEELRNWLTSFLPRSWFNRLVNAMGMDSMIQKFLEITAFLPEQEQVQRRAQLIFATKPLVTFIKKHLIKGAGQKILDDAVMTMNVFGLEDWNYWLSKAYTKDREEVLAEKKKAKAGEAQQAWADELLERNHQDYHVIYERMRDQQRANERRVREAEQLAQAREALRAARAPAARPALQPARPWVVAANAAAQRPDLFPVQAGGEF